MAEVQEPALAFIEDVGLRLPRGQPRTSSPTPARPAARCSGSTATSASPRTRRRTRPTPASSSATRAPRTSTRPASTCTSSRAACSWPAASGTRTATRCTRIRTAIAAQPEPLAGDRRGAAVRGALPARRRDAQAPAGGLRPRPPADRGAQAQGLHRGRRPDRADVTASGFLDQFLELCARGRRASCASSATARGWRTEPRYGPPMDIKLELVSVPVTDVDRAKAFYVDQVGFHADHDHRSTRTCASCS